MRMVMVLAVLAACLLGSVVPSQAQDIYTPQRGDPERAAILDAVRPAVETRLFPPIEFVVSTMNVSGPWAYVVLQPQRPGGGAIDPLTTRVAEDARAGMLDGLTTDALLLYRYDRWNLIAWSIGATDVVWDPWPQWYGAPRALFR